MLEMHNDMLRFSFPDIHPDAILDVTFVRTLRIPDDDRDYPLPPGLGHFPLRHVDDFADRVPAGWVTHGGVMLPMYQAEALWISFNAHHVPGHGTQYPFAVKVGTGKVSAVTGDDWQTGLREKDYLVTPPQPWLDGYCVEEGVVRQFVAAPLGWGFSAEEQITGKAEHGGVQIEVFPMKADVFRERFPRRASFLRSTGIRTLDDGDAPVAVACAAMGIAPGGRMKQQIFEDKHGKDAWDLSVSRSRCFVHLANSLAWRAITREEAPSTPVTAKLYTDHGYPWFDYYEDSTKSLVGTGKVKNLKSVLQMGFQKGLNILPENESMSPERVVVLGRRPGEVRVGSW